MPTLTLDDVQSRLSQIIDEMHPGEEVVILAAIAPLPACCCLNYREAFP